MPNRHLWFGTGIHLALGEWYGEGTERRVHPLETWEAYCESSMVKMRVYFDRGEGIESEWVDAVVLGRAMLTAYLEEYGNDENWHFVSTEQAGTVKIPSIDGSEMVLYAYTFDGVIRNLESGNYELVETKTAAAITIGHLSLDDQAGSYWAIASNKLRRMGILQGKDRIAGINYNFLRKSMPDERPRDPVTGERCNKPTKDHYIDRLTGIDNWTAATLKKQKVDELEGIAAAHGLVIYGEVSKTQPPALFLRHFVQRTTKERNTQIRRIAHESMHMKAIRDGILPVIKTPRSTGNDACQYGCEFFLMCELQEAGANWEDLRKAMYTTKDPYADHRKSANAE